MKKTLIILFTIALTCYGSVNQGHFLASIYIENDNQCVISGTTVYAEKYNKTFIAKLDKILNLNETTELSQKKDKEGAGLIKDANNNSIILSMADNDSNKSNIRLIKLDVNNTIIWDNTYDNDNNLTLEYSFRTPIIQTTNGSFLIMSQHQTHSCKSNVLLYKIDKNGNKLWEKSFGTEKKDKPLFLLVSNDDTYTLFCLVEVKRNNLSAYALYIVKMDNNGNKIWSKTLYKRGSKEKDYQNLVLTSAVNTPSWDYILSGSIIHTGKTIPEDTASKYILKMDSKGNTIWGKSVKGEDNFSKLAYLFKVNSDYVSFAITLNSNDEPYVNAIKFDINGSVNKVMDYKEPKMLLMRTIALKDNGFMVIGGRSNEKKETKIIAFKVDKNLNVLWEKQLCTWHNVYGLPIIKERPDGKVIIGYTYKKNEKSSFQIQLKLLDQNGTILKASTI